jgi:hypothetical protein
MRLVVDGLNKPSIQSHGNVGRASCPSIHKMHPEWLPHFRRLLLEPSAEEQPEPHD